MIRVQCNRPHEYIPIIHYKCMYTINHTVDKNLQNGRARVFRFLKTTDLIY